MSGALDWFVSYTAADERWAEWIAWQLEEQGFTVKLQKWDVPASANFAVEMHEAASKAERTLAVLSAAYCQSGFGAAEWAAAFVQDPTGKDGKLLPVRIADFKPPGLFAGIVGIDLFGKSEREARAALLAGVKRERGKPEGAPDFPAHAAVTHAPCDASTAPGFPSALPAIFTLPFRRNPFFAGRAEALAALRSALGRGPSAAPSPAQAIHGLGGVGKTQLAVEYAWANASEYEAVLWAVADSPERLRANLAALAASNALGLPERAAPEQSVRLEAVLHWLKTHQRWLLILDGADSPAAASAALEVVPASTTGHLIITSRRTDWPLSVSSLPVAVLPEPAATRFLVERTKRAGAEPGSADDARAVAAELGCLPLALEQAAAYVERKRLLFRDYLRDFEAARATVLQYGTEGGTGYRGTIFSAGLITEAELSAEARAVLRLTAFLAAEDIPRDLFAHGADAFREAVTQLRGAADPADPADPVDAAEHGLLELADYSLIALGPQAFSCHRLVMAVQRDRLPPEEHRHWLMLALKVLDSAAPTEPTEVRTWPRWEALRPHLAEAAVAASDAGVAEPTAQLMSKLGSFLSAKAEWPGAEDFSRRALALIEQQYGPSHPERASYLNNLATVLLSTGRLSEAEPLIRRSLEIVEKADAPDHRGLALCLHHLGVLLRSVNRPHEAEPRIRRSLEIFERCFGLEHADVAMTLNSLGVLLRETNRHGEAELVLRRALAVGEKNHGLEHPDVAVTLSHLGTVLAETHRIGEAELVIRRALAIDEKSYGPEHPHTAATLNDLGTLFLDADRPSEAEPLFCRALAILEHVYGPNHLNVAIQLNNTAMLLKRTHRLREAEPLLRRSLAIVEVSCGHDHPQLAIGLNNLATLLVATRRVPEAERLSRRCLVILLASALRSGHDHSHLKMAEETYSEILRLRGFGKKALATRLKAAKAEAELKASR